jgi:hypothetical protein
LNNRKFRIQVQAVKSVASDSDIPDELAPDWENNQEFLAKVSYKSFMAIFRFVIKLKFTILGSSAQIFLPNFHLLH